MPIARMHALKQLDELISEVQQVRRGYVVVALSYPFTAARYDLVTKLLTEGRFKLINPRVPDAKPLEIILAPNLLELAQVTCLPLAMAPRPLKDDDDDEPRVVEDLSAPLPLGAWPAASSLALTEPSRRYASALVGFRRSASA